MYLHKVEILSNLEGIFSIEDVFLFIESWVSVTFNLNGQIVFSNGSTAFEFITDYF